VNLSPDAPPTSAALGGPGALVEARGIDYVPDGERWGGPARLFWLWAGAVWNVEYLVYGTVAIAFLNLSFAQAVPVIVIGNLFFVLTGLASLQGPVAGTTTFTISRAAFGPRGNRAPSFFNWVTQVGFEVEGIGFIVLVAIAIFAKGGVHAGTGLKALLIVAAVLVQAALPLVGHAAILRLLKWLTYPFVALYVVMAIITASKVNLHVTPHGAGWGSLFVFLALVISAGGLGWTENASDYSRYLPAGTDRKRTVLAVTLGAGIAATLSEVLGAAVATAVAPAHAGGIASITGLAAVFPNWFVWPYFVVAILQLFAINSLDLYSSGVTLQSLGIKLKRYHCVLIDTVVCGALAAYWIFSAKFNQLLYDFLLFIIVWLGPWFAIYFIDYLLRGKRYDSRSLLNERGGRYWRQGGIHWPAIIAQAVGMGAAMLWLNAPTPYLGPLASRIGGSGGSDFSVFMGLFFGGATYWLLARHRVPGEETAEGTPPGPAAPATGPGLAPRR
jgi:nucleobase:cation symporter-1, NCS1 family